MRQDEGLTSLTETTRRSQPANSLTAFCSGTSFHCDRQLNGEKKDSGEETGDRRKGGLKRGKRRKTEWKEEKREEEGVGKERA